MDRYPYLGTLYYLTSIYLCEKALFLHNLNTHHKYAYQVFGAIVEEIAVLYVNMKHLSSLKD